MKKFLIISVTAFILLFTSPWSTYADTIYNPVGKSNGYKVYLSPAKHSPEKVGCSNYQESANASKIATETAKDLQAMGYTVRVGTNDYVTNTTSSNNWGSRIHVPIHSNATTFDCSGTTPSRGGTWIMHYPGATNSATKLLNAMKNASPGTNDKILTDVEATGSTLYEVRSTNMEAPYVEAAFHTYGPDVTWLLKHGTVGQTITNGIHSYTGAADCRTQTCVTALRAMSNSEVETIDYIVKREDFGYDLNTHGSRFSELENDIKELIKGNNPESVFVDGTAGMLNGVSIDEKGTVVIDFKDFTGEVGSPSTYLMGELNRELYNVVFKYQQVQEVYYQFDGSFSDWCYWLEIVEEPVKRMVTNH
ncbi:N-acetylmuramoyl-L-alanine amidase [Sutcliffiella horikoshii]|uniref:N-acetylmuramoyl-L-alanine amidase n=1 Tax=Sutcliffiella horikoshii TaxID=79883 RepID=UPI001CFCDE66|nr:N-acetylmuramoyl-L-alanine amidase [Sutcliffiella horikoshii]